MFSPSGLKSPKQTKADRGLSPLAVGVALGGPSPFAAGEDLVSLGGLRTPRPGGLTPSFIPHSPGGWKPKVKGWLQVRPSHRLSIPLPEPLKVGRGSSSYRHQP